MLKWETDRVSGGYEVMTVRDLADYLRVHQSTIYRLANGRRLRGFRLGGNWRFLKSEVMKDLELRPRRR